MSVKVGKLVEKVRLFIHLLDQHNDLIIRGTVDQFYYMERVEELEILYTELAELTKRFELFEKQTALRYRELAESWSRDCRWVQRNLRERAVARDERVV